MGDLLRSPFPSLARINPELYAEPFWDAAREHRFVCQKCADCGQFRMPPAPYCWKCRSAAAAWDTVPGTGTVYSYTVVDYTLSADITQEDLPYVPVIVKLDGTDEQKFIGLLVGEGNTAVKIGDRVETIWDDVEGIDVTVPRFCISTNGASTSGAST